MTIINSGFYFLFFGTLCGWSDEMYTDTKKAVKVLREKAIPKTTILGKMVLLIVMLVLYLFAGIFFVLWQIKKNLVKPLEIAKSVTCKLFAILFIKQDV